MPGRIFRDTSAKAEEVMLTIYRRMPAWRKIQLVEDANRTARHLTMVGLRSRYPDEPLSWLRRRLIELVLGAAVAERVYGRALDRE
jgi:hypothetical protein